MKDIALIVSTIPIRHNLLLRSLETWKDSIAESGLDASINIWSEGCAVSELVAKLGTSRGLNVAGQEAFSGSPELGSNYWVEHTDAKVYMFLHPEIMLTSDAVRVAYDNAKPKTYCTFRIYWMPQYLTETFQLHLVPCVEDIEKLNDLYQYGPSMPFIKYLNLDVREKAWESDTCWSMCSEDVHQIFPIPVFGFWGPIDCYLAGERSQLGITTYNPPNPVYHQWHPKIEGGPPGAAVEAASRELNRKYGQ